MDLKDMLRQLDEDLLAEILEAAHCALNRPGAAKRVAKAMNTSVCLLYTSPSPRDVEESRMPSSA